MDITVVGTKIMELIKKYKYVILVLVIGIALMLLPTKQEENEAQTIVEQGTAAFQDPSEGLKQILSQIEGAGKVQVLLTKRTGERTVYQTNQNTDTTEEHRSVRVDTVIVTNSDRTEQGLIQQVQAPEYRGAIVVCQGADNDTVRLAIVEAVSDVTGLGADRISVLKMK